MFTTLLYTTGIILLLSLRTAHWTGNIGPPVYMLIKFYIIRLIPYNNIIIVMYFKFKLLLILKIVETYNLLKVRRDRIIRFM